MFVCNCSALTLKDRRRIIVLHRKRLNGYFKMWGYIRDMSDGFYRYDKDNIGKLILGVFVVVLLGLNVLIYVRSPGTDNFRNLYKINAWFGEDWHYVDGRDDDTVKINSGNYLKVDEKSGHAIIEKVMNFTPESNEYLMFRVRAYTVNIYVNDRLVYANNIDEKYPNYAGKLYTMHLIPAAGIQKGDRITLEFGSATEDHFNVQYISMGDRYALTAFILRQSAKSLLICAVACVMIILCVITSFSSTLIDQVRDISAIRWLAKFLVAAVVYIAMDSGCMEIFIRKMSIVSWMGSMALLMLPIPFIMFTKYAFFPDHKRYEVLATIDFALCVIAIAAYTFFAYSLSHFFIYVHLLIAAGIIACITSFAQEKMMPAWEVLIGYGAIIVTALLSVASYWFGFLYPASTLFGYGLLIFSINVLFWIVRSRYELKKVRDEVNQIKLQRDKEAAEDANRQKSRFLSQMSHEIRTPLNAILGMNELIMHETDNETILKYADNIQSAGRTLLALINDVLDFSKIESGKLDIVESDYSLSSLLNDIVVMTKGRADDKGLDFMLDIDENLPDLLWGDEIRIKQVITNLMTNAIKYTKTGWVQLTVKRLSYSEYLDEDKILLDIMVSDSGVGIREEEKSKLFTEFERLDRKKNKSIEGTGLGLSITSRLVALMKGTISVESQYQRGSTFRVTIPQKVVSDMPIGDYKKRFEALSNESKDETSLENLSFAGKNVLVVDDNEMNLEVIASILELMEIEVERAGGGQEAINRLDSQKYDLILTDDMMPEVDGTEVMRYLRNLKDCINHGTPIVVLTANAIVGAREEYVRRGFDDYMTKPIDIDVLRKILVRYLG